MANKFFNKVETPESQGKQFRNPSGPSQDVNVHQKIQNEASNIGGAIQDLLGIAVSGAGIASDINETELNIMETQHGGASDSAVRNAGKISDRFLETKASELKMQVHDMTPEQIEKLKPEMVSAVIDEEAVGDKSYLPLIKRKLELKLNEFVKKKIVENDGVKKEFAYQSFNEKIYNTLTATTLENMPTFAEGFQNLMNVRVGNHEEGTESFEIQDTFKNTKKRALETFIKAGIESGDDELLDKLKHKSMRELYKDVPEYDKVLSFISMQVQSTINKKKQVNLDTMEDEGFGGIESGEIDSPAMVDKFFNEKKQTTPKGYQPNNKDSFRLKSQMYKAVETEANFRSLYGAVKKGDSTAVANSGLTVEEQDNVNEKIFKAETGIIGLTCPDIQDSLLSGEQDSELQSFANTGLPYPKSYLRCINTRPVANQSNGESQIDAERRQVNAVTIFNSLTQGTSGSIDTVIKPDAWARTLFMGQLIDKLDSGVINEQEFNESKSTFDLDLKRNVNSFGVYTSSIAQESKDDSYEKWLTDSSTDNTTESFDFTWDDNSTPEYTRRQLDNNYNLMITAGLEPDEARSRAETMYEGTHQFFENPDGTEGVLPKDFKHFNVDDIMDVALILPQIAEINTNRSFFDSLFDMKGTLAVRPVRNYEQTRQVQIYYEGTPVFGTKMSASDLTNNINTFKTDERIRLEEQHEIERVKKLEEFNNNN